MYISETEYCNRPPAFRHRILTIEKGDRPLEPSDLCSQWFDKVFVPKGYVISEDTMQCFRGMLKYGEVEVFEYE